MPTTRLLPAAAGTDAAWSNGVGTVPTNVQTDDGDTTYRTQSSAVSVADTFQVDALPAGEADTVTNVDAAAKARRSAGGTTRINVRWRNGGSGSDGATQIDSASYTLVTETAVARPGGGSWVPSDFDGGAGAECGYVTTNTGVGDTTRATWCYFDVTWTYFPSGGFVWLLSSWLPPLLAVASHGLTKLDVITILRSMKTRPSSDEDVRRLLEAFAVRPRFLCLQP